MLKECFTVSVFYCAISPIRIMEKYLLEIHRCIEFGKMDSHERLDCDLANPACLTSPRRAPKV